MNPSSGPQTGNVRESNMEQATITKWQPLADLPISNPSSDSRMSCVPDTFHRFGDLPIELRLRILRFGLNPRLIAWPKRPMELQMQIYSYYNPRRTSPLLQPTSSVPLALLGVNKESHDEISSLYHNYFGFTFHMNGHLWKHENVVLNPQIDTLFIENGLQDLLLGRAEEGLSQLRYVALHDDEGARNPVPENRSFPHLANLFSQCEKLERLSLCLLDPDDPRYSTQNTEEIDAYKGKLEKSLKSYWAKLDSGSGSLLYKAQKEKWEKVVRVMYFREVREERRMTDEQRAYIEIS